MSNKRNVLAAIADAAIVVLALAVVTQIALQVYDRFQPSPQLAGRAAPPQPDFVPGDKLPQAVSIGLSDADFTLLMFLSSKCGYCTASMPFYTKLAEVRRNSTGATRLAALSAEPREVLEAYLQHHEVVVDAAIGLSPGDFRKMKVRGTPTLILASRDGTVRNVWIGKLGEEEEVAVLAAVAGNLGVD